MKYALARVWVRLPLPLRRRIMWMAQPKFTVGISAVILNEREEVLLLRHRFRESDDWQFPGGYVGRGEHLEEAVRREVYEETGYEVKILGHLASEIARPLHIDIYAVGRVTGGSLTVDYREILEAHFFSRDELPGVLDENGIRTAALGVERSR